VVDEAVDGGDGDGRVGEHLVPLAEGLIAGDDQAVALVSLGDQLEEDGGLGLILSDVAEIIEDDAIELVELGESCWQDEIAAGGLEFLHEIGGAGEEHAIAVIDKAGADGGGDVRLSSAARPKDEDVGARLDPGIAGGERGDMGFAERRRGGEVEGLERLARR